MRRFKPAVGFLIYICVIFVFMTENGFPAYKLNTEDKIRYSIFINGKQSMANFFIKIDKLDPFTIVSWCEGIEAEKLPFSPGIKSNQKKVVQLSKKYLEVDRMQHFDLDKLVFKLDVERSVANNKPLITITRTQNKGVTVKTRLRGKNRILSIEALLLRFYNKVDTLNDTLFWVERERAKRMKVFDVKTSNVDLPDYETIPSTKKYAVYHQNAMTGDKALMFDIYLNSDDMPIYLETASRRWALGMDAISQKKSSSVQVDSFIANNEPLVVDFLSKINSDTKIKPASAKINNIQLTSDDTCKIQIEKSYPIQDGDLKVSSIVLLQKEIVPQHPKTYDPRVQLNFGKNKIAFGISENAVCDYYARIKDKQNISVDEQCKTGNYLLCYGYKEIAATLGPVELAKKAPGSKEFDAWPVWETDFVSQAEFNTYRLITEKGKKLSLKAVVRACMKNIHQMDLKIMTTRLSRNKNQKITAENKDGKKYVYTFPSVCARVSYNIDSEQLKEAAAKRMYQYLSSSGAPRTVNYQSVKHNYEQKVYYIEIDRKIVMDDYCRKIITTSGKKCDVERSTYQVIESANLSSEDILKIYQRSVADKKREFKKLAVENGNIISEFYEDIFDREKLWK